mmetsp:Transcript_30290/g.60390  ORF Transcript_30290/g.60390 Transcript_30290/m.60390 type:complete len:350 (-) Transcript_30290:218-1267(-)|eukprot:CAMPEP_0171335984 /NCGR_PEP_ID=MMETSP0878-20121228/5700_1 /TAXON_ID=67004 /ORGANISM="Thalassiosira weissflogii, Strain CCMP1336" /LENGTH=349 /DNA_ID=CAMNT_0011837345 /DNA_START=351 /DNA_END=1400 /DNA_ORIENTATION=+
MGNVAIAFINSIVTLSDYIRTKRQIRSEKLRLQSLIPRYLSRLHEHDATVTSIHLNGMGVDCKILRLLSNPLIYGDARVEDLYLENNWIGSEGATCIARILSQDKYLKNVSLAHNQIGSVGAMAIASALESNEHLERLNLSHCNIDDKGIEKLAASLKKNSTLHYLNLEGNPISSSGVYSLLNCVYDVSKGLKSIWESNHSLRAFYGQRLIYSPSFPETWANRKLVGHLGEILATCNRRYSGNDAVDSPNSKTSKKVAASCKILRYYLNENSLEYLSYMQSTETKMVPHVLGWLGKYGDVDVIYRVVKDLPWLLERIREEEDDPSVATAEGCAALNASIRFGCAPIAVA